MTTHRPAQADALQAENAELRRRLDEAEETLRAIQSGSVDAVVVEDPTGHRVYTLEGADRPYRLLVEQMQQGAATLHADGTVAYCNRRAAELFGLPLEHTIGAAVSRFVHSDDRSNFEALLAQGRAGIARGEVNLAGTDGARLPVLLTINVLPADSGAAVGLLVTDLTAQKHHERLAAIHAALLESEAKLRRQAGQITAFLETAAIGLHRVGPDGLILWANDAELSMFGYTRNEYVGHPIAAFHVDAEVIAGIMARLYRGETLHDCAARVRCKDGSIKHVLIDSSVLWDEGRFIHTQCFTRDITERVEAERRMLASEMTLRDADRRKNQFLAMLAHELRNPLAPILSATHVLRLTGQGSENPSQRRAREIIERQTGNLAKLVNDLLDIARLTTGRIELHREPVDLREVVRHALETTASSIGQRRHRVSEVMPEQPVWLHADPTRLEEIVVNLLSNAAKYTPEGGHIEVAIAADEVHGVLRVRDSGIGMAAEVLPHVFDLFTQADASLERSQGGLGIGLHVVQRLVELHGGAVSAHSAGLGKGSEFVVRLPRTAAPVPAARAIPVEPPIDRAGLRVLVVDDNGDARTTLSLFLQAQGYSVQMASTGPAALECALQAHPDVVLLDIGLPELSGYEVARGLRQRFSAGEMLLVAITGYGRNEDYELSREAGFDAHLLKPIDPLEIDRLVATWSRRRAGTAVGAVVPGAWAPRAVSPRSGAANGAQ